MSELDQTIEELEAEVLAELEEAIDLYSREEEYEACAGILKAIHESGYLTIKDIILKIEDEQRND